MNDRSPGATPHAPREPEPEPPPDDGPRLLAGEMTDLWVSAPDRQCVVTVRFRLRRSGAGRFEVKVPPEALLDWRRFAVACVSQAGVLPGVPGGYSPAREAWPHAIARSCENVKTGAPG